jgi:hypothetical protein
MRALFIVAWIGLATTGCTCSKGVEQCTTANCQLDGGESPDGAVSVVSIQVRPANDTLTLTIGTTQNVQYTAVATFSNGTSGNVPGSFSLGSTAIGTIDGVVGLFTANGSVGGTTNVEFTPLKGPPGSTPVTVQLNATFTPGDGGSDPRALFADAGAPVTDPTAQAILLYPLDQVVFPQNVNAPTVQWVPDGGPSDWYRVTYAKPHVAVVDYVQNQPGFTFSEQVPDTVFWSVEQTDPASVGTVVVDRLDVAGKRVVAGSPVHMSFAQGSVSGTVYYWAMDEARLHRLPGGTTLNQPMFPSVSGTSSTDPGYTYSGCVACHQVSRDGRYLAASGLDTSGQAFVFDLTAADPTQPNMPVSTRAGFSWYFSSISPDDTRIFATTGTPSFAYTDISVKAITPTGTVPTTNVAHPNWSPDGKTVAFISNVSGWQSDASFTGGDLTLVNVDTSTDAFSNLQVIHQGASLASSDPAGGDADCFPSWTPDSKYLMFAHTQNTRATGETRDPGSLYIIPPNAGATPVRLAIASDSAGQPLSHYPATSPFTSGGFYWIVFYSTRDYGNALAGTAGTGRPQLWVSAISTQFDGTHDPGSVPYWLPGQSTQHENADAQWAASACHATGSTCVNASDCCSGTCDAESDGGFVCATPTQCRPEGESCDQTSDCCAGLVCDTTIHTCQVQLR